MSDEAIKEKKKLTKKSKILIIVLSIVAFLLIATVLGGVIALNQYCKTKDYTVISTSDNVTLVAHRGMRSVAPENTTASFAEAGKHGYWGAECDVYRTKDGVWIISHDSHTYRMMDKSAFIEKKTYEELMDMNVDNGVNIDKYEDLKICSLEEYTEYYSEIVDLANQFEVNPVYISFHIENLQTMRRLTQCKMYYLVQKISEDDIQDAKSIENCGIDFNGNKDKNFKSDIIKKCQDAGLELGAWTINEEDALQKLEQYGITLITTDCIEYAK